MFSKKNHKIDEISGAIYRVKPEAISMLLEAHKTSAVNKNKKIAIDP